MITGRNNRLALRLLAAALTVCVCVTGGTWMAAPPTAQAEETSDLQAQIAALETKRQQAQQQAAALQDDIDAQQELQDNLQSQIQVVEQQVTLYQQQIDSLGNQIQEQNQRIDSLNMQLEQSQAKRDQVEDLFHQRMRALYLEGDTSTLELLLGAKSYTDFLTRSQYMSSQASSDQAMLDELLSLENQINADREAVESTRNSLEANQAQVQSLKAEQDAKIADLETLQQQSESEEAGLQQDQDSYNRDAAEYQAQLDQANAELEAIARANANKYANRLPSSGSDNQTSSSSSSAASSTGGSGTGSTSSNQQTSSSGGSTSSSGGGTTTSGSGGGSSGGSVTAPGDGSYLWPCASHTISSTYGYRWGSMHRGLDIAAPAGTDIYASKSGVVIVSMMGYSGSGFGGYGNVIMIQHNDGTYTLYAHCQARYVSVGDVVSQGQVIAAVGSTGDSTGNHLHFEIRMGISSSTTVDPQNYL